MKKQLLIAAFGMTALNASAQTVITDTVITSPGYANQIWYSLENDEQGSSAKNNWDLGFRVQGMFDLDILVNHTGAAAAGALWVYPHADISGWATADTVGLSTWTPQYNSETAWMGALGRYAAPPGATTADYGWGFYNRDGDHKIKGDSIYFIKTQAGFKKLKIELFTANVYTFTYSNLDGSDETTSTISKAIYTGKKYAYFSLDTKTAIDREPAVDKWDLVFGQYSDLAGPSPYTVTGVVVNDTTEVAKAKVDPAVKATYKAYSGHTFSRNINGIGYDWKTYTAGSYKVNDSSIYFIKTNVGDIWKVIFTGFMSTNGSFIFSKEKLPTTSIGEKTVSSTTLALSPNPSVNGQNVNIVYNFDHSVDNATVRVYDMSGRMVATQQLEKTAGLHTEMLNNNMAPGVYIISVVADNELTQQRLIVQ